MKKDLRTNQHLFRLKKKMLVVHEIFFSCFISKLIDVKNCQSIDNIDILIKVVSDKSKGKSQSIFSSLTFLKVKHILALQKSAGKAL